MIRKAGLTVEPGGFEEHTYRNAQQKVQILDSTPSAAEPLISEGNKGYFNNKIYEMIGGVLYEYSVTPTV